MEKACGFFLASQTMTPDCPEELLSTSERFIDTHVGEGWNLGFLFEGGIRERDGGRVCRRGDLLKAVEDKAGRTAWPGGHQPTGCVHGLFLPVTRSKGDGSTNAAGIGDDGIEKPVVERGFKAVLLCLRERVLLCQDTEKEGNHPLPPLNELMAGRFRRHAILV
jgi:hypothetical protein